MFKDETNSLIEYLKNKVKSLEEENEKLSKKIEEKDSQIFALNKKLNELIKQNESLSSKKKIAEIRQILPKSEKVKNLIDEAENIIKEEKELKKRGPKKGSKNHSNFNFEKYVSETKIIAPQEKICPNCGTELIVATSSTHYEIEIIPAKVSVIKYIVQSKKCPKCNKKDNKLFYPVCLTKPFPGSALSTFSVAYLLYYKYYLGIPFNSLEKYFSNNLHFDLSKQNMANFAMKAGKLFEPIVDKMKHDLLTNSCKIIHSDETTLVVSKDEKKEDDRLKNYVFVYASSYYDPHQMMIYSFSETRNVDSTISWLKNYSGTIICDCYSGYKRLQNENKKIKLQYCLAHARRKFTDILKTIPNEKRKDTQTYKILHLLNELFKYEAKYKKDKLEPNEILKRRKNEQTQLIKDLKILVFDNNYAENTTLNDAVLYLKKNFDNFFTYLDDGYVEISNNLCERAVKPFVVQRKMFQTSGSYQGAYYTGIIFSLIQSARINNLDVLKYLDYVLKNSLSKLNNLDQLLPYSENCKNLFFIK